MSQQQSEMTSQGTSHIEQLLGLLLMLSVSGLSSTVEVFLRKPKTFGQRYAGMQVAVGGMLLFLYPVYWWHGHNTDPIRVFLVLYIAMLSWIRLQTFTRVRRGGPQPHTRYAGTPRIASVRGIRRLKDETIRGILEPALVILAGAFTAEINGPLGGYLIIAGFALLACSNSVIGERKQRAMRMHDAQIEQQAVVQQLRDRWMK